MTRLKKNNNYFILTISFMIVLLVSSFVPAAMAWFTDRDIGTSSTTIEFGTVDVNITEDSTVFTATRSINYLLPGDTINFSSELSNIKSTVPVYAGIGSYLKIKYAPRDDEEVDITSHFQPYISITPLSISADDIVDGTDGITYLNAGETAQLTGSVYFDTSLPNAIGYEEEYVLNGHKQKDVVITFELHILVGAIQYDNLPDAQTAEAEIKKLIYGKDIAITGADVNNVSLEAFTYLKSYIDIYHENATILTTANVTSPNTTLTMDVSELGVAPGENIAVLHYDETEKAWETIGTYPVADDYTVTATFTSLSPIALLQPYVKYNVQVNDQGEKILYVDGKNVNAKNLNAGTSYANDPVQAFVYEDDTGSVIAYISGEGSTKNIYPLLNDYSWYAVSKIVFGEGITSIGKTSIIHNENLSIEISSTVETIENSALAYLGIANIKYHPLGNLKTIKSGAFMGHYLTKIYIPKSVQSVEPAAFESINTCVEKITLEYGSEYFMVSGNCLIEKATKTIVLLAYEFEIPDWDRVATSIRGGCFTSVYASVILPSNIYTITTTSSDYWPSIIWHEGIPEVNGDLGYVELNYPATSHYDFGGWHYYKGEPCMWGQEPDRNFVTLTIKQPVDTDEYDIVFNLFNNGRPADTQDEYFCGWFLLDSKEGQYYTYKFSTLATFNGFNLEVTEPYGIGRVYSTNILLFSDLTNNTVYLNETDTGYNITSEPPKFELKIRILSKTAECNIYLTKNGYNLTNYEPFVLEKYAAESVDGDIYTFKLYSEYEFDGFYISGTDWTSDYNKFGESFATNHFSLSDVKNKIITLTYDGNALTATLSNA